MMIGEKLDLDEAFRQREIVRRERADKEARELATMSKDDQERFLWNQWEEEQAFHGEGENYV